MLIPELLWGELRASPKINLKLKGKQMDGWDDTNLDARTTNSELWQVPEIIFEASTLYWHKLKFTLNRYKSRHDIYRLRPSQSSKSLRYYLKTFISAPQVLQLLRIPLQISYHFKCEMR
jgi:hypothetical protein